jgi:very-short-patch-repair endonuclease
MSVPARPVDPDNLAAPAEDCQDQQGNPRFSAKSPPRGPICQFQQVRERGEAEIIRLAQLQHGHVHRLQLSAAGLGRGAVMHRLETGWLQPIFPSAYRLGAADSGRLGRRMAAALHFKGNALIAGLDAADLWEMLDTTQRLTDQQPIDVLLLARSAHPVAGIRVRRVQSLARQDVRWRAGIPVTSPAWTVLYLASSLDDLELETAASVAFRRHGLRSSQLADVIARNPRAKGVARVRDLLARPTSLRDTRSKYERKLLRLIAATELPAPVPNAKVAGHMVDLLWPDLRLVVEFDSWSIHGRRGNFETDRLRDQNLAATGHQVVRVTARQIDKAPYALAARLATVITTLRLGR